MKTTLNKTFRLTAVAAALLAAYGSALAQQDPEVAKLISPSANDNLSIGGGYWSKDRPFQGQYDGMSDGNKGYLLFDGQVHRRDDVTGTWFKFDMRNMGLDTREARLSAERQGDIGGYIDFNQIPRDYPWTINTNLGGLGTPNMTVNGAPPTYETHLSTKRDRTTLGFFKNLNSLMPGLKFKVDFRNEDKKGEINYGLGSQPLWLAQPIDSRIRQLDALFEYSKDKLQLRGGYYASWYDTSVNQVFGLRSSTGTPGSTQNPNPTPLSQPLDNQSWEVYLDGGYSFTPTTRGTFKVKYGKATMDEQLPSYGLTGVNAPFVNMTPTINGRVDTTLLQAGITSRPMPKLSIVANLRYYDMDDKTPLVGVIGNNGTGVVAVHNTPQSIKTTSGKFEAAYRLPQGFKVIGTIDGKHQDRSLPQFMSEIYVPYRDTKLKEWNYGIQVRRNLTETVNGSLGYVYSKRDGSSYALATDFHEDLISPWHIADRNRDKWRLKLDWTPADNFTLVGVFEDASDKYPHDASRPYGMTKGSGNLFSLDATYQINDAWKLTGFYAYDQQEADRYHARWQRTGAQIFEGTKTADLKDKSDTLGLNLDGKVDSKWKLGGSVLWTKSRSSYNETWDPSGLGADQNRYPTSGGETAVPLPNITTELTRLGLYADYAVEKNASLRFDVIYEDWKTNDWSYTFSNGQPFSYGTTGAVADGTTFTQKTPQQSTYVGLRYKHMLD